MLDKHSNGSKNSTYRFLLVEDVEYVRLITKNLINEFMPDCLIDEAATVAEAIACALIHQYDLILMDIGLPDGNGKMACLEILNNPISKNHKTPIIAVTGHADNPDEISACLQAGMKQVVKKPLTIKLIEQVIQYYFKGL